MGFLLLGIDSLIAGVAIGSLVDKDSRLRLAVLFGLADGAVFLIGAGLGWGLFTEGVSEVVEIGAVVALGLYLLVVAAGTQRVAAAWPMWVLPFALTVDNLTYGLAADHDGTLVGQASQQAVSSGLLAFIGLLVGAWLPSVLPATRRYGANRVAGVALLFAAGALFLVG
jgi:hypothetical protein